MFLAFVCVAIPTGASAQLPPSEPDPSNVSVRIGPLYLNPTISLTNLGIDTNVFNEAVHENPKRDFTFTVEPRADLWLRIGPTWLAGQIGEQVIWYQKYSTERSSNTRYQLGWRVPLNRLTFQVEGSRIHTHERPGFEIDARAERVERGIGGAAEVRLLARTFLGVRARRSFTDFADDAAFEGESLDTELNRTSTELALTARNQLTPLTSLNLAVSRGQDRFQSSPLRDSDSTGVNGGLQFDRSALLQGGATFGYRRFRPRDPSVPDFAGTTIGVDLSYVLLGSTRFNVQVTRDVAYSFDVKQPYYLQTGLATSIAQQIFGPVDVVGRYGAQRLSYRDRVGALVEAADRVDSVRSFGFGFGYHLGRDLRIGVNVDRSRRLSPVENRQYQGFKFGTAVTYGA
jgi:hypothetical protein